MLDPREIKWIKQDIEILERRIKELESECSALNGKIDRVEWDFTGFVAVIKVGMYSIFLWTALTKIVEYFFGDIWSYLKFF